MNINYVKYLNRPDNSFKSYRKRKMFEQKIMKKKTEKKITYIFTLLYPSTCPNQFQQRLGYTELIEILSSSLAQIARWKKQTTHTQTHKHQTKYKPNAIKQNQTRAKSSVFPAISCFLFFSFLFFVDKSANHRINDAYFIKQFSSAHTSFSIQHQTKSQPKPSKICAQSNLSGQRILQFIIYLWIFCKNDAESISNVYKC